MELFLSKGRSIRLVEFHSISLMKLSPTVLATREEIYHTLYLIGYVWVDKVYSESRMVEPNVLTLPLSPVVGT